MSVNVTTSRNIPRRLNSHQRKCIRSLHHGFQHKGDILARTISTGIRSTEIHHNRCQLLQQIDFGLAICNHHSRKGQKNCMEEHGMSPWATALHIKRQWYLVHKHNFSIFLHGTRDNTLVRLIRAPSNKWSGGGCNQSNPKSRLKKLLDQAKGEWVEELNGVFWAYHTTHQSATKETPLWLTYGVKAMIPLEIESPWLRRELHQEIWQDESTRVVLDLTDETRKYAQLREIPAKQRVVKHFNKKVSFRTFKKGNLVLRKTKWSKRSIGRQSLSQLERTF